MDEENLRQRKKQTEPKPGPSSEIPNEPEKPEKVEEVKGPFSMDGITPDMSPTDAYFHQLRAWVEQANIAHNAMACFPYYLMANYPQMFQAQQGQATGVSSSSNANLPYGIPPNFVFGMPGFPGQIPQPGVIPGIIPVQTAQPAGAAIPNQAPQGVGVVGGGGGGGANGVAVRGDRRIADYFDNDLRQEEIINQNGGYEFIISPLWKRFVAELIDVIIVLFIKLLLAFTIVDFFDINLGIQFDLDALKKSIEDDYTEFLSFSSDLILIEIITKLAVCIYEALWTMNGNVYVGGASPGKILMGIRILHVEAVLPLQPQLQAGININNGAPLRALLYPATNPGFKRALFRSIAKNILMTLLFPMCFVMLFFKNNRTAYDIMTKTIVVEENHAPVHRRR